MPMQVHADKWDVDPHTRRDPWDKRESHYFHTRLGASWSANQGSAPDNNPEAHIRVSSNRLEALTSGQQSKRRKRKLQQSHGQPQLCKRVRGSSATASKENSFSSLRIG
jgi:hypothetical protein